MKMEKKLEAIERNLRCTLQLVEEALKDQTQLPHTPHFGYDFARIKELLFVIQLKVGELERKLFVWEGKGY